MGDENKAPCQKEKEVGEAVPYGRMGTAEDLTWMAVFIARRFTSFSVLCRSRTDELTIAQPVWEARQLRRGSRPRRLSMRQPLAFIIGGSKTKLIHGRDHASELCQTL